ncbi:MAG: extra-cytoplasmic solute receptor family protein [Ramlibacter sp.]|jgi:tripartite-type tricarboxylate transporter receptor subunit TctC|nr:extra-cytoplasmic solute receptor family protein [Ramlibacter sp.]
MPDANRCHASAAVGRRDLLRWAPAWPLAALGGQAWAQDFPARPLRLVVPFPAGGPTDALARLAAEGLASQFNQSVVVENKAGAAGGIAAEFVSRAAPDGLTLLVAGQGLMFINKPLYRNKKLSYDPDTDYAYVGMLGSFPNAVVSHPDAVPAQTIGDLFALARANPGKISYGSNGIGSLTHLTTEMMAAAAKVKFLHVPYQGAAPQMTDLLSGRIGFAVNGMQSVLPHIQQKKLRALAVTTATRYPELPDVPTLVESGFPALDLPVWFAVYAPAATPAPILDRLRSALAAVTATPAYGSELAKRGAIAVHVPIGSSGALFARERGLWVDAVRTTGATAD